MMYLSPPLTETTENIKSVAPNVTFRFSDQMRHINDIISDVSNMIGADEEI